MNKLQALTLIAFLQAAAGHGDGHDHYHGHSTTRQEHHQHQHHRSVQQTEVYNLTAEEIIYCKYDSW
jgi:hypothetical protein